MLREALTVGMCLWLCTMAVGKPLSAKQTDMRKKYMEFMNAKSLAVPDFLREDPNFEADLELHAEVKKANCTHHTICTKYSCADVCEVFAPPCVIRCPVA